MSDSLINAQMKPLGLGTWNVAGINVVLYIPNSVGVG